MSSLPVVPHLRSPLEMLSRDSTPTTIEGAELHFEFNHPIRKSLQHPFPMPLPPDHLISKREQLSTAEGP